MEAGKYRKRPLLVQAVQLSLDNGAEVAEWCGGELDGDAVLVPTMRGQLPAFADDFVMQGTHREFYPIRPEVHAEVCMTDAELLDKITTGLARYILDAGPPVTYGDMSKAAARIFAEITADPTP